MREGEGRGRVVLPAAVLAACLTVAFFPVIFEGRTLGTAAYTGGVLPSGPAGYSGPRPFYPISDPPPSALQDQPWDRVQKRQLADRRLPLWNAHQGCGMPLFGNGQAATLDPLRMAVRVLPETVAWDVLYLARLLLAGWLMALFVLARGRGTIAATFAGIAFALTGYFVVHVNMSHLSVEVLIPGLLLGVEWVVTGRRFGVLALAGLTAWATVAGMPESLFLALSLAGAYSLFRLVSRGPLDLPRRSAAVRLGGAVAAGLLLAAPALFPLLENIAHSQNVHSTSIGQIACHPAGLPAMFDPVYFKGAGGALNVLDPVTGHLPAYVGLAVSLVALLGIGAPRFRGESWFCAAVAAFYLLKAFGAPVFAEAISQLPLLRVTIFPKYGTPLFAFAVASLASIGVDRFLDAPPRLRRVAGILLLFALLFAGTAILYPARMPKVTVTGIRPLDLGLTVVVSALFVGAALTRRIRRVPAAVATALLVVPLAFELVGYVPRERLERHDAFAPAPYLSKLPVRPERERLVGTDMHLLPNTASAFGKDDIRFLEALVPRETYRLLYRLLPGVTVDRFEWMPAAYVASHLDRLSFLNVGTIVGSAPAPRFVERIAREATLLTEGVAASSPERPRASGDGLVQPVRTVLSFRTRVPRLAPWLDFEPPQPSAGARLSARREPPGAIRYEQSIDPKRVRADRRWFEGSVDLSSFRGSTVKLTLESDPGPEGDSRFDFIGWSALRLGGVAIDPADWIRRSEGVTGTAPAEATWTIGGETRSVLQLNAPARFDVSIAVPAEDPTLRFEVALDPRLWAERRGDVAVARLRAGALEAPIQLWSPAVEGGPMRLDLSPYAGEDVTLLFEARGIAEASPATAVVTWPRLVFGPDTLLETVPVEGASVQRNLAVLPRAFLVSRAVRVASNEEAIERVAAGKEDLAGVAFVEGEVPATLLSAEPKPAGRTHGIRRSTLERLRVSVDAERPALLVTTETFYPGWKATVDREPATILRVDGAFRGVVVPAGSHEVRFVYQPLSLRLGWVGLGVGILILAGLHLTGNRRRAVASASQAPASRVLRA